MAFLVFYFTITLKEYFIIYVIHIVLFSKLYFCLCLFTMQHFFLSFWKIWSCFHFFSFKFLRTIINNYSQLLYSLYEFFPFFGVFLKDCTFSYISCSFFPFLFNNFKWSCLKRWIKREIFKISSKWENIVALVSKYISLLMICSYCVVQFHTVFGPYYETVLNARL